MSTKPITRIVAILLLCTLVVSIQAENAIPLTDSQRRHCASPSTEEKLLELLGLNKDVRDAQIIELLNVPEKQTLVIGLIRRRKISSAKPRLLEIIKDEQLIALAKTPTPEGISIALTKKLAAEALCDFGNKEWIPTIKALSMDPNCILNRPSHRLDVAGLLARGGDYSEFEIVVQYALDSSPLLRQFAILALGNFGHKSDPVADDAAELLTLLATSDSVPSLRRIAIYSLEKIAKTKPDMSSNLVRALRANVDSPDKNFALLCRGMLRRYTQEPKTD